MYRYPTTNREAPHQSMQSDMECEIHNLEKQAYAAVLRAFKAQSDALTWEKEGLITELRKELRVSDEEHRELLTEVNADDLIHKTKEWRKANHNATLSAPQHVSEQLHSPSVSASRKKQKTSQSGNPFRVPSQTLHPRSATAIMQSESSAAKWGPSSGMGGRRPNAIPLEDMRMVGDVPLISQQGEARGQMGAVGVVSYETGRTSSKDQVITEIQSSKNEAVMEDSEDFEILHTETLIKKLEKVLNESHPDKSEIEKALKILKEHEQALVDVIAKLDAACGDDEEHPISHGHVMGEQDIVNHPGPGPEHEIGGRAGSYEIAKS